MVYVPARTRHGINNTVEPSDCSCNENFEVDDSYPPKFSTFEIFLVDCFAAYLSSICLSVKMVRNILSSVKSLLPVKLTQE